jgi:hypothetical protein
MTASAASGATLRDSSVNAAIAVPGPAARMSTPVAAPRRKETNAMTQDHRTPNVKVRARPAQVMVLVRATANQTTRIQKQQT